MDAPEFSDRFLSSLSKGFARRRKAISHHGGKLLVERTGQSPEHLVVRFAALGTEPTIILEATTRNRVDLLLTSSWSKRRGKVLLRVESMRIANARAIVSAFEWTIAASWYADPLEGANESLLVPIAERWQRLALATV